MSCKVEKIGTNKAKFTIEVDNATFLHCEDEVFNKQKGKLSVPGFRKGKVTKDMAFKVYGREAFLEDTINECINHTYSNEISTSEEKVLSQPKIDVLSTGIDKPLIYTAEVAIVPEVKLGKYKGIAIKKTKVEVSEADVEAKLKEEQEKNARLVSVDRKSKMGDIVSIDFDGYVDGKQFAGGKAEKYQLELGSKSFIDNFEEQLVDKSVGDDVDVNVTFPEGYQEKSLSGKPALFKVKINEIKEKQLPEIDDEFVSEISEFETLKDYRADIKKNMEEEREKQAVDTDKWKILDEVAKNTTCELAQEAIDSQVEETIYDYSNRLKYQGLTFEKYLEFIGKDIESFKTEQKPIAEKKLKNSIILEEIAKVEKIEASDEMVNEEVERMAKSYGMELEQFQKAYANDDDRKQIKADLLYPAVMNYLYENASLS